MILNAFHQARGVPLSELVWRESVPRVSVRELLHDERHDGVIGPSSLSDGLQNVAYV